MVAGSVSGAYGKAERGAAHGVARRLRIGKTFGMPRLLLGA